MLEQRTERFNPTPDLTCHVNDRWQEMELGECAQLVRDNISPTALDDTPYIGLKHIGENSLALLGHGSAKDVTSTKSRFRQGDVLFGKLRPYFRKVVRAPFDGICSTDIWVIRPRDGIDAGYLYYLMATQQVVDFATQGSIGTKMPRAKWDHVGQYPVHLPPLSEQRRIAGILGALDDKIELNRRMNETLEEMARAIFKDWFVDFGPVRAKMEGREAYLPEEIWRLFPDRLVESELGEVPEGWVVVPLPKMTEFREGPGIRHWQYTNSTEGTRFINIRCIQDGDLILDAANRVEDEEANGKYAHFQLQEWDIAISASGTLGRSAVVRKSHLPLLLNTSVIRFRPVECVSSFAYMRGYLGSYIFLDEQRTLASGSVQKNFGPTHL